jgi:hypothetical protein
MSYTNKGKMHQDVSIIIYPFFKLKIISRGKKYLIGVQESEGRRQEAEGRSSEGRINFSSHASPASPASPAFFTVTCHLSPLTCQITAS